METKSLLSEELTLSFLLLLLFVPTQLLFCFAGWVVFWGIAWDISFSGFLPFSIPFLSEIYSPQLDFELHKRRRTMGVVSVTTSTVKYRLHIPYKITLNPF